MHYNTLKYFVSLDLHTLGIISTVQPNGLAVPDASMHPVTSTSDVLELIDVGLKNRAVGATAMNERSSRSHRYLQSIFVLSLLPYYICLKFSCDFDFISVHTVLSVSMFVERICILVLLYMVIFI